MTEITAAIVSGGISLFINIIVIWRQRKNRQEREENRRKKEWYQDVIRSCRSIEREAYLLDPSIEVSQDTTGFCSDNRTVQQIDAYIEELEEINDRRPTELEENPVSPIIDEIEQWHRSMPSDAQLSAIDIKEKMIDDSRLIKQKSQNQI